MKDKISSIEQKKMIATKGNTGFAVFPLNDNGDDYTGEAYAYEGVIDTNVTINQTVTQINADNNPRKRVYRGPVTLSGTIKFGGIHIADFIKLFSVEYDDKFGLRVGEKIEPKHLGVSWLVDSEAAGGSVNKVIIYDCVFELPPLSSKTDDGTAINDFTVSFSAAPVTYPKADGTQGTVTYAVINNKTNVEGWERNVTAIQYPQEWELEPKYYHNPLAFGEIPLTVDFTFPNSVAIDNKNRKIDQVNQLRTHTTDDKSIIIYALFRSYLGQVDNDKQYAIDFKHKLIPFFTADITSIEDGATGKSVVNFSNIKSIYDKNTINAIYDKLALVSRSYLGFAFIIAKKDTNNYNTNILNHAFTAPTPSNNTFDIASNVFYIVKNKSKLNFDVGDLVDDYTMTGTTITTIGENREIKGYKIPDDIFTTSVTKGDLQVIFGGDPITQTGTHIIMSTLTAADFTDIKPKLSVMFEFIEVR